MDILRKYGIKEDQRLKRARREFLIALLVWLLYTLASLGYAFGVSGSNPNAKVLGFPWWFHFLTISVIFMIVIICVTKYFVKETDLSPWKSEGSES